MTFLNSKQIALGGLSLSLAFGGLLLTATGCAGSRYQRSTGTYLDDKALGAKVKTALFRDPMVSGIDVGVNTFRGNVQLSGFVDTPEQKQRAENIAWTVEGVGNVMNDLETKPAGMGSPATAEVGESRMSGEPAASTESERISDLDRTRPADRAIDQDRMIEPADTPGSQSHWSAGGRDNEPRNLEINVANGRATVRGIVSSEAQRRSIERSLKDIPGVVSVENMLEVRDNR